MANRKLYKMVNERRMKWDMGVFLLFVNICNLWNIITRGRFETWNKDTKWMEKIGNKYFDKRMKKWFK